MDLFSRAAPKNVLAGDAERPKNPTSVDKRSITSQTKNSRHQQPNQDQIEKKDKNGARLGMSAGDLPPAAARPHQESFSSTSSG